MSLVIFTQVIIPQISIHILNTKRYCGLLSCIDMKMFYTFTGRLQEITEIYMTLMIA